MSADTGSLNTERLDAYLRDHVEGYAASPNGALKAAKFKGGQSNPTYQLTAGNGTRYVLRKKPDGVLLPSAHAVDREYRVITALRDTDVPVART
ncbi:MAG: aminoglycoside phosphotransferase [Rhizobacter sp.]|nr:aminoglycoside phosphotransferase [Rhizobacter sp.]